MMGFNEAGKVGACSTGTDYVRRHHARTTWFGWPHHLVWLDTTLPSQKLPPNIAGGWADNFGKCFAPLTSSGGAAPTRCSEPCRDAFQAGGRVAEAGARAARQRAAQQHRSPAVHGRQKTYLARPRLLAHPPTRWAPTLVDPTICRRGTGTPPPPQVLSARCTLMFLKYFPKLLPGGIASQETLCVQGLGALGHLACCTLLVAAAYVPAWQLGLLETEALHGRRGPSRVG